MTGKEQGREMRNARPPPPQEKLRKQMLQSDTDLDGMKDVQTSG